MRINVVLDNVCYGDGVSHDVFSKTEIFRNLGYSVEVYTRHCDKRTKELRKDISDLNCSPDDILIHHYSGRSKLVDLIKKQKCKKVLVYHNITPVEFVDGALKDFCREGYAQLKQIKNNYDFFVCDSAYNSICLKELGVTESADVLPIEVSSRFANKNATKDNKKGPLSFLVVGRIVKNKAFENILDVFNWYYSNINSNSQLYIVGNTGIDTEYFQTLQFKKEGLPANSFIYFLGKVSDEELARLYTQCDAYLCMSKHEGFCIPIVEAMMSGIPVFAYNSSAIAWTMGNAGVLFDTNNPRCIAEVIHSVLQNETVVNSIREAQFANSKRFSYEHIERLCKNLINKWMDEAYDEDLLEIEKFECDVCL